MYFLLEGYHRIEWAHREWDNTDTHAFNFALERGAKTQHRGVASIKATPKFYREQSTER
jgi:hypothetical protein